MIYCDASLMVASLATEPLSDIARKFLSGLADEKLVVSPWVSTEVASALAMKMRQGVWSETQRNTLLDTWRGIAAALKVELVEQEHFHLAETLVNSGRRGLRAGDALHLAIARCAGFALATLDRDLADAAESVGVEVALRPPA